MGFSTTEAIMMGMAAGGAMAMATAKTGLPAPQAPQAPPQMAKAPDVQGVKGEMGGMGQAGGAAGAAQTMLTGPGGVDPNLLQLGKATLLGQ